jgi:hypothetical protein
MWGCEMAFQEAIFNLLKRLKKDQKTLEQNKMPWKPHGYWLAGHRNKIRVNLID